jgi:hypothetical protein
MRLFIVRLCISNLWECVSIKVPYVIWVWVDDELKMAEERRFDVLFT